MHRAVRETNTPADVELARNTAEKALVLLKNDGILPLDPRAKLKLAVIGPNAATPALGGYSGQNRKAVSILAGLQAAVGPQISIGHADGVWITEPDPRIHIPWGASVRIVPQHENQMRIAEAVKVASESDVVLLVVGDNSAVTREGIGEILPGDRSTLGLFGDQDALVDAMLNTGKPVIALLLNGRPLAVRRLAEEANALF